MEDGEEDGHQMHEEVHSIQPETEPRWPLQGPHAKTTLVNVYRFWGGE